MAVIPNALYPSQTDVDSTNYPQGKARDVTIFGDGSGTPFQKAWLNDLWGFEQALLAAAAITPSGTPDTAVASQYLDALRALFAAKPLHNQIVGLLPLQYTGGLSQSNSSSTPATVNGSGFTIEVQAGDVLELHFGPIWASSAAASGSYAGVISTVIEEDSTSSGTPVVQYQSNIEQGTTQVLNRSLIYTCTKSGVLWFYLMIFNNLGVATGVSTNGDPNFGFAKLIRP